MLKLPYQRAVHKINAAVRAAQIRGDAHLSFTFGDILTPILIAQSWARQDAPTAVAIGRTFGAPPVMYFLLDIFGQPDKTTSRFAFDDDAQVLYRSPAWQQQVLPYSGEVAAFPLRPGFVPPPQLAAPVPPSEAGPPTSRFDDVLETVRCGIETVEDNGQPVFECDFENNGLLGLQIAQLLAQEKRAVALTYLLQYGMAWSRLYVVVRDIESLAVVFQADERPLYLSPEWREAAAFETATYHRLPERPAPAVPRLREQST